MSTFKRVLRALLRAPESRNPSDPETVEQQIVSRYTSSCIAAAARIAAGEKLSIEAKYSLTVELIWLSLFLLLREVGLQTENTGGRLNPADDELVASFLEDLQDRFFEKDEPEKLRAERTDELLTWFRQARAAYRGCKRVHLTDDQLQALLSKGRLPDDCVFGRLARRLIKANTSKRGPGLPAKLVVEAMTLYNALNVPEAARDLAQIRISLN